MKDYSFNSNLILRTPLLGYRKEYEEDKLKELFSNVTVQEAIYLSSPTLYTKLKLWLSGKIKDDKEKKRLEISLGKYLYRMSARCTPFGLMAGCGVVEWASQSNILLQNSKKKRRTRLDMQYLCALIQHIENIESIKKLLLFHPNNTIYKVADRLRYVEYFYKDKRRVHQISSVSYSSYLELLLDKAKKGAKISDLVNCICGEDVTSNEAENFINNVISAQILVSELQPNVSGSPVSKLLLQKLEVYSENEEVKEIIDTIKRVNSDIQLIDKNQKNNIDIYRHIQKNLQKLNVPFDESKLFQTDMYHQSSIGQINGRLRKKLRQVCSILSKLNTLSPSKNRNLEEFKNRFYHRYEAQQMPLSEVLDTEMGIGYLTRSANSDTPLVDDLIVSNQDNYNAIRWSDYNRLLFSIINYAFANNLQEVDLQIFEKEINQFSEKKVIKLPDTLSVMFKIAHNNQGEEQLIFGHASGTSGVNLIARFADGHAGIKEIAECLAQQEETLALQRGEILAEIIHLPESRTGNILFRPAFRSHEIAYLAQSTLEDSNKILISDLYISIQNGEVVLWSKKLNRRIIPRLSNAHNFSFNSLPIYHFLCDIQNQNIQNSLYFSWGSLISDYYFLPRITYNGVIISEAQWTLTKKDLTAWTDKSVRGTNIWRKKYQLPLLVKLSAGDNELLINFKNELSIAIFAKEVKNKPSILLKEHIFDEENAIVKDKDGNSFTNEFIAFLVKEKENPQKFNSSIVKKDNIQRTFVPGSEWIYYKIYCGNKSSDSIITNLIVPFIKNLKEQNIISKWFFIRYADPEPHIRFRLLIKEQKYLQPILQNFQRLIKPLVKTNTIWKLQTDTYVRELERYKENNIIFSESLFQFDSECTSNFLCLLEGGREGERYRWLFSLISIDRLLDDFKFNLNIKIKFFESLTYSFGKEFGKSRTLSKQINKKYNREKDTINSLFIENSEIQRELEPVFSILNERSSLISSASQKELMLKDKSELEDLLSSYIHMLCNRLFIEKQRKHELIIYEFLLRYYRAVFYQQPIRLQKVLVS